MNVLALYDIHGATAIFSNNLGTRVADPLKQALRAYAGERGLSQTAAVVELLERGLEQTVRSSELEQTQARLRQAELDLHTARARLFELFSAISYLRTDATGCAR